ncbi:MAG: Spy/CpxP family protein refolding chaperone [Acetobacteraceae bacterium]
MASRVVIGALLAASIMLPLGVLPAVAQTAATVTNPSSKVEAHIERLRTELGITPAEIPQWDAFAAVMRQNAAAMETLYRERSQSTGTMNAVQILESYRDFSRMHVADLDALVPAFAKLYAVLSPEQKQMADALFADRAAHRRGSAR